MKFTDETVAKYEGMIAGIAWCYTVDPHLHKDLMQEGYYGLRRAYERFDPTRGFLFSTYAHGKIRSKMQQYMNYKASVVHMTLKDKKEGLACVLVEMNGHDGGGYSLDFEQRDLMSIISKSVPAIVYDRFIMEVSVSELSRRKYGKCDYRSRRKVDDEIREGLGKLRTILGVE